MPKANNDLRMMCKGYGVPLWAIAEKLGISDQTLLRKWRKELPEVEKAKIRSIIRELKEGVAVGV